MGKVGSRSISSCGVVFKVIIFVAVFTGCSALAESNNDKFCVIHVGPHKTGSTSLQAFFLVNHKGDLKKDNYESPQFRNGNKNKDHAALAFCIRTELPAGKCSATIQHDRIEYFESFVDDAAAHGSNILLSSEELDRPNLNITQLTSVLVPHQYKIHVVVYYRRFYDWIHSLHNQETKKGRGNATFVQWLTDDILEQKIQTYSVATYNRYKEAPGIFNVSVVKMHEDPDNFNTNARFACNHMDNAPHLCEIAKSDIVGPSNPSENLDWNLFRNSINIYHSIELSDSDKDKWEQIEVKFHKMTDIPRLCVSTEWKKKLLQISLESEKALTPESWYSSEEGLENLMLDFEEKINSKLCSIDIERILLSSEWQDFLMDLQEDEIEEGL